MGSANGARPTSGDPAGDPSPSVVTDMAQACVGFVDRVLKTKLDFEPETLPLLDHYVQRARGVATAARPAVEPLVAHAVGAYFGEVVRRRHRSWWVASDDAPSSWEVQLEAVHLSLRPIELAYGALEQTVADGEPDDPMRVQLLEEDRDAVASRLADLPEVSEDEYRSFSTILEVIDIAVDAIRARRAAAGESPPLMRPRDYDPDPD